MKIWESCMLHGLKTTLERRIVDYVFDQNLRHLTEMRDFLTDYINYMESFNESQESEEDPKETTDGGGAEWPKALGQMYISETQSFRRYPPRSVPSSTGVPTPEESGQRPDDKF